MLSASLTMLDEAGSLLHAVFLLSNVFGTSAMRYSSSGEKKLFSFSWVLFVYSLLFAIVICTVLIWQVIILLGSEDLTIHFFFELLCFHISLIIFPIYLYNSYKHKKRMDFVMNKIVEIEKCIGSVKYTGTYICIIILILVL